MAERHLFNLLNTPVFLDDVLWIAAFIVAFVGLYFAFLRLFLPFLRKREDISPAKQRKGTFLVVILLILFFIEVIIKTLDINVVILDRLRVSLINEVLILMVIVYLILWLMTNLFIHRYFIKRDEDQQTRRIRPKKDTETIAINSLRWLLFSIAILVLLNYIDWDYTFFKINAPKEDSPPILIRFSSIIQTIVIYFIARLLIWVITQILLYGYYTRNEIDRGIRYAINTLFAYFVYFIATLVALRNLGMNLGLLIGGAAALLVGVGLALQSTFSDFFSGLVLLFERPIAVGDFVTYEGKTVQVQHIGLRATKVKDRDSVNFIIPNSKLISQTVMNWSYDEDSARFSIMVGVAYGSDTRLVERLLLQAAQEHPDVLKNPKPRVNFHNFGESSLDFLINYYSKNIYNSNWVKSDIRFRIDELFREHNVTIPFPQRDVWLRNQDQDSV
jgi:small-conductance mechanosensitive channel